MSQASPGLERIRVGSYELAVRVAGSGRPLLLVHGARGSSELLVPQIEGLAGSYTVYAPDLPGHGESPLAGERLPDMMLVLAGLVRQLGLRSVAVAGFSRGGVPAVRLAARHPSTVTALILACPAGLPRSEEEEDVVLPPATARTLLRDRLVGPLLADPACITAEFSALMRRNAQRAARFERLRAIQQPYEPDVSAELPRIHMPCLILWGREDPLMPVSNAFRFQRAITGAELYIFPGLRHLFHYEAAAGFNDRVHSFLAAHDRQPTAGGGPGGAAD